MKSPLTQPSRHSWFGRVFLYLAIVTVSGCSGLSEWRHSREEASLHGLAPSDRFLLPPQGVDIVGNVQITAARHEDTLLDIARRYNL